MKCSITRLAWRNLRARPGQALLLLLALCVASDLGHPGRWPGLKTRPGNDARGTGCIGRPTDSTSGPEWDDVPPVAGLTIADGPQPSPEDVVPHARTTGRFWPP